jgi:hypothetical protein
MSGQSNRIVFAHLRRHSPEGGISPFGGITIAMKEAEGSTELGIAVCHDADRFVKKQGRVRAEGRLHSTSYKNAKYRATVDASVNQVFDLLNGVTPDLELGEKLYNALRGAGAQL